jgi:hypothetical protein
MFAVNPYIFESACHFDTGSLEADFMDFYGFCSSCSFFLVVDQSKSPQGKKITICDPYISVCCVVIDCCDYFVVMIYTGGREGNVHVKRADTETLANAVNDA